MSSLSSPLIYGTYTSTGAPFVLRIPSGVSYYRQKNYTQWASTANPGVVKLAEWNASMPAASAFAMQNTNGAATDQAVLFTTGGFSATDTGPNTNPVGAATALTAITAATPAVVSTASTSGLFAGAVVRIYGTTGMLQVAGMDFTVGTVVANTSFQLAYLAAAGFAAPATAGFWRQIAFQPAYYPRTRYITGITQAASAVITMSVTHNLTVGQLVRVYVPAGFGMTQMNGQLCAVTAINTTTNTITVNVNSTAYTAFAYPTSATAAAGISFPQVVPVGDAPTLGSELFDGATDNQSYIGLNIGSNVCGALNDVIYYEAWRGITV